MNQLQDLLSELHDDPSVGPDQEGPLQLVAPDEGANRARRRALTRRTFIGVSLGAAGTAALTALPSAAAADRDPFTLGVASGDPTTTGIVLWTRLAVDPFAEDGKGGMPNKPVTVSWQLATDDTFHNVVRAGAVKATSDWAHSVHVEVDGLQPDRWYWYRFRVGKHVSPIARTRTLPGADSTTPLHAVAVSCSHYELGYFTAYHHAAQEQPDLVLALGDYIYEGGGVPTRLRPHPGSTCITLADFRRRYALYKAEAEAQELHHAAPWAVTWDDHEVQDQWAGIYPKSGVPTDTFEARRAAAARAYYENMPLRRRSIPNGSSIQLFRRFTWGRTADIHVLDTRQYRDRQACHDGGKTWWFANCAEQEDPSRTLLGKAQTDWLVDGFQRSRATWQVMPQGVFFSRRDITEGPVTTLGSDAWDGYRADRDLIRDAWAERGHNGVVLTGDVHASFANEVKADFEDPDSRTVGVELVATSISSSGDGYEENESYAPVLAENPHIKWINGRRGYLSMNYNSQRLDAKFMSVPYVTSLGAPVELKNRFEVEAGAPALHPA